MKKKKNLPPTYFMLSILIIVIFHFVLPLLKFIYFPWNLFGLLLTVFGGILNLLADKDFKRFNTTVKPFEYSTTLINKGVFSFTRNPMYLGMVFILLGLSVFLGSISPFFITIAFTLIINFVFIIPEEKMLLEKFNREYIDYKRKVRRWI